MFLGLLKIGRGKMGAAMNKPEGNLPFRRDELFLQRFLILVTWLFFIFQVTKYLILPPLSSNQGVLGLDFQDVYHAAEDCLHGTNPYLHGPGYPLMVPILFSFLPRFSLQHAEFLWNILMRGSVLGGFLLIMFTLRPTLSESGNCKNLKGRLSVVYARLLLQHWTTLAAGLTAGFTPVLLDIRVGNIQSLVFFLFCLFCTMLYHRQDLWAGGIFVLLCLVKIVPVILLPVFFFSKRYRLFFASCAGLLLYIGISFFTGGWRWEYYLFSELLPHFAYALRGVSYSLVHFIGTVVSPAVLENEAVYNHYSSLITGGILGTYLIALCLAAKRNYGLTHLFSKGKDGDGLAPELLVLGVYSLTLASPLLETHHFTNCIPGWIFLFHTYLGRRCGHGYFWTAFFLWLGSFICREMAVQVSGTFISPVYGATFCLLLLWLITVWRILFFLEKTS
jgi:hypothetical protein